MCWSAVPRGAVVAGAAFSLYAVGTVGADLEWAVYPGHEPPARAADFAGFRICYADTRYRWCGVGPCPRFSPSWAS